MNTTQRILIASLALVPVSLQAADVAVTADISADTTWTANNSYILDKPIFVTGGKTLTIEPGTTIYGKENTVNNTFGSLVVTRGSKLIAEGTCENPIVFTAIEERDGFDDDNNVMTPNVFPDPAEGDGGFWGGLVMLGDAPINFWISNVKQTESEIEGFPTGLGLAKYGGANPTHNGGVLKYVSIRFGGFEFAPNKEINGLTLGGVGSGTTIENVEVVSNTDDGVEFFGGTVNTKRIAVAFCQDDSFDLDEGYSGYNQFWFSIQNSDSTLGDRGGEWDGLNKPSGDGTPVTSGSDQTTARMYNVTMLGNGADAANANIGILLDDAFAGTLANSVIHDFSGVALSNSGDGVNSAKKPTFNNNTWGTFVGGAGIQGTIGGVGATDPAGADNGSVGATVGLRGISRTANGGLDPRPKSDSPLLGASLAAAPVGAPVGFYETVTYRGAFAADSNWLDGWSYLSQEGYLGSVTTDVAVTADVSVDTTWTSDKSYILDKPIFVTGNKTLTIEPGTTIYGKENTVNNTFGSLVVTRGSKLIAEGTCENPIVFTAIEERDGFDDDNDAMTPNVFPDPAEGDGGFWGGVVLLGDAPINFWISNVKQTESEIEGFPTGLGLAKYGGANPTHNGGVLKYVSIRFGGFEFAPNKEINGLTLGGVGSGTTIENVEVVSNTDDGVEFFGGTVNTKRIAVAFCQDDSFDLDEGYSGYNQFWFSIQNSDSTLGDRGGEWDGLNKPTGDGTPVTSGSDQTTARMYNVTMLGNGADAANANIGILLDDAFAGTLANSVIHDFSGVALSNSGDGVNSAKKPTFNNNTWGTFVGGAGIQNTIGGGGATNPDGANNGVVGVNPLLGGISRIANAGLDPRPTLLSPLRTSTLAAFPAGAPVGFFETVSYRGAFGDSNWLNGWSYLYKTGYLPEVDCDSCEEPEATGGSLTDTDNDGIDDDLEETPELVALGFTVGTDDSALFADIYTEDSILDLVTGSQIMIQGGGAGNPVTLSLPLFRSNDLSVFTEAPDLEATFNGTGEAEFYRIEVSGAE